MKFLWEQEVVSRPQTGLKTAAFRWTVVRGGDLVTLIF